MIPGIGSRGAGPASRVRYGISARTVPVVAVLVTLLFGVTAMINFIGFANASTALPLTHLAAAALSLYLLIEARLYLRRSDVFGVISPVFFALVFHFYFAYLAGITSAVFEPHILKRFSVWLQDLDKKI